MTNGRQIDHRFFRSIWMEFLVRLIAKISVFEVCQWSLCRRTSAITMRRPGGLHEKSCFSEDDNRYYRNTPPPRRDCASGSCLKHRQNFPSTQISTFFSLE